MTRLDASRVIRAPRGSKITAQSWLCEAPLRMLMNNLDPEVAENPQELVVYGGIGRAARNWEQYDRIVATLKRLRDDQTLLIQSGKAVGVFETHADAPRVLLANSNLVPHWATWEHFHALDRAGLMMFGQMTAGSWIYIGSQGIVQGTYETFVEMGRQHYGGSLRGRWILTAGLGGMGGAQPLAAVMAGASCLAVECDPARIEMRLRSGYLDAAVSSIDKALAMIDEAVKSGEPRSIGLLGNAAQVLPELLRRGVRPDVVTDQTSAHDPLNGYLPLGWTLEQWREGKANDPHQVESAAKASMAEHVRAMLGFHRQGIPTVDYGNNIRQVAKEQGVADAFAFPGFVPAYIRPLFCRGIGPFRWCALSGDPEDIYRTDAKVKELLPHHQDLHRWLDLARQRIRFQGLPARICWVGLGDRHRLGLAFNEMVAKGEVSAPIVIGRDHLDSGSVASPNRETEAMADGSDAVSDWPLLNALLNCASGATWVSLHHGGGVGMGFSQHAGVVIVCDGTDAAARRIARVLWNDPATGVMRHADAGYELAKQCAREKAGFTGHRSMTRIPNATPVLWFNGRIAACDESGSEFQQGAIVTRAGRIEWIGSQQSLPEAWRSIQEKRDLQGRWVTPGLVDCHTHLVFAGNRASEWNRLLNGATYEEIARSGGGIIATVVATRRASEQELFDQAAPRLECLRREGVTTVEIKSGYGLTLDQERKMLRVARSLGEHWHITIRTTLLAAHAVPPEFAGRSDDYIDVIIDSWLPTLHGEGLVDTVDVFCERIAFDAAQSGRLLAAASKLGLPTRMHAAQLSNNGACQLAAKYRLLSCDHLEYASRDDVRRMADAGTIAVLLPTAFLHLREKQLPPVDELRSYGVPIAIASDCNPGSSPSPSLQLAAALSTRLFRLTPAEALAGITRHAAQACGIGESHGVLRTGSVADFAVWDVESLDELPYWIGRNACVAVVRGGEVTLGGELFVTAVSGA